MFHNISRYKELLKCKHDLSKKLQSDDEIMLKTRRKQEVIPQVALKSPMSSSKTLKNAYTVQKRDLKRLFQ